MCSAHNVTVICNGNGRKSGCGNVGWLIMDLSVGCLATKKVGWLRALMPTEVSAYVARDIHSLNDVRDLNLDL